ncbi:hypothetical protein, partial [Bacillus cereus]|uniref:hypothetical protein n=1 Tax=Bacillus cereus TaxID=1396 RepID=UPI001596CFF2
MDFLLNLLQDAVKIFFTVFVTAYANKLVKKIGSKRKRTAPKNACNEPHPIC